MKKIIFTVIAVAAATISCTKSNLLDAPEAQMTPISFDTYTGKTPTTKAVSETTETLAKNYSSTNKAFHVNAFVPGTYSGTYTSMDVWASSYTDATETTPFSATWTYDGKAYWPTNGQLDFVAYGLNAYKNIGVVEEEKDDNGTIITPGNPGTPILVFDTNSHTKFTYTVPQKVSEQEDLIVAATPTSGSMPTDGIVSLTFKHMLSRVGFMLKTTKEHEGVSVTIKSIVLKGENFATSGTVNFLDQDGDLLTDLSIAAGSNKVTSYSLFDTSYPARAYDYFFTANSPGSNGIGIYPNMTRTADGGDVTTGISANDRYMMLIPGGVVTGAEVYYQLPNAEEQHVNATLDSPITLVQGKAYEFVIKLSTDAIEFSGEVIDWDPVTDTDIPQPEPEPEPEA